MTGVALRSGPATDRSRPPVHAPSATAVQIRGSSLLLVGRFIAIAAGLVVQVLVVRSLSQDGYGAFAYGVATVALLTIVVGLGLDQAIQRFGAIYDEEGAFDKLLGALILQVAVIATLGSIVVVATYLAAPWLQEHLIDDATAVQVLEILVLLAPVLALDAMMLNLFALYARPGAVFVRRYLISPGLKVVAAALAVALGWDVVGLAWAWLLAGILGVVLYLPPFWRLISSQVLERRVGRHVSVPARELLTFTVAAVASDLVIVLLFASDVIIVGWASGTEGVATLQAVQPLATGNQLIFYALIPLFIPLATRLFAHGDLPGVAEHLTRTTIWSITFGFPVLALTFCFARPLTVSLFGSTYEDSAAILAVLAVGQYVQGAFGLAGLTLKVLARLRVLVVANVSVAAFNIAVNLVLVPRYGAIGAAMGTTVSLTLLTVIKLAVLRRPDRLVPGRPAAVAFTAAVVAAVVLATIGEVARPDLPTAIVLAAVGSTVVLFVNRRSLQVDEVFPEVMRTSIGRWVFAS